MFPDLLEDDRALGKVEGVQEASVNLATEKARVVFDPELVGLPQLMAAVEKAGYKLGPPPTERAAPAPTPGAPVVSVVPSPTADEPDERELERQREVDDLKRKSLISLIVGLAMMAVFTLLPLGTIQLLAAIDQGYWYARSHEFMQQPLVDLLVWMRVPGDTIFSIGALVLTYFVARLWLWPRKEHELAGGAPQLDRPPAGAEPEPAE